MTVIQNSVTYQDSSGNAASFTPAQQMEAMRTGGSSASRALNGVQGTSTTVRENFSRYEIVKAADVVPGATTKMSLYAMPLSAGDTVAALTFLTGTTAANVPLAQQAALYSLASGTFSTLARSNNNGTTAWPAATAKSFTMGTPYVVTANGVYYAGLALSATTVPSFVGKIFDATAHVGSIAGTQATLAQTTDAPGGTCPPSPTATTAVVGVAYVVAT